MSRRMERQSISSGKTVVNPGKYTYRLLQEALQRECAEHLRKVQFCEDRSMCLNLRTGQHLKVDYACWSKAGRDPQGRPKQNQDSFVVKEFLGGSNTCFFGVFDGHGSDGAKVSWHLVSALPRFIMNCDAFKLQRYKEAFGTQIPECNRHLVMTPQINSRLSGSTAITAILQDNGILTVANVGDSRCILGRVSGDKLRVAALNTDHTPEVPEEADRILANEGRIGPYSFDGVKVGPKRVWLQSQDLPGLSMTRALGDQIGAAVGVTAEPELVQVALTPEDKYLVLCSDGLFEFMDNEYIMSIIHHQMQSGWRPSDIAKCLVAEANRQWMEEEEGIIDDCTIILVVLDIPALTSPSTKGTPPHAAAPSQPITSVAQAMRDIAQQNAVLISPDSALPQTPSITKLSVKIGR